MNYSLKQLRVFVAVARYQSFSRAGDAIGLSQSAISHSMKELEAEIGVRLLDRTTREVILTNAGQRLASRVEPLLDELHAMLLDTRSFGTQHNGRVRIAASQTISAQLMPSCIARSQKDYPDITILLRDQAQRHTSGAVLSMAYCRAYVLSIGDDLRPFSLFCRGRALSLNFIPYNSGKNSFFD